MNILYVHDNIKEITSFASPDEFLNAKEKNTLLEGPYVVKQCTAIAELMDEKTVKSALAIFAVQFPTVPTAKKDCIFMII